MRQGFEGNARTIDRALAAKVTDGMIVQPAMEPMNLLM